jgi:hypothetical protein
MPVSTDKYQLSDGSALLRIKREQFKHQIPALLLLLCAFLLNIILPGTDLMVPALVVALAAIAWYLLVGAGFRFRQRIPIPPPESVVSPLQGKVNYIRSNDDITLVNIRKTFLDMVELRSPNDACRLEEGVLSLNTPSGKVSFRFNIRQIRYFDEPDYATGNLIGLLAGNGSCTITLPRALSLAIKAGDTLDAGDPILMNLKPASPPPSIVLDAVGDIGDDE